MTDEWDGLGISWLWGLPETHPFQQPGLNHDAHYELHDVSQLEADKQFLRECVSIADGSLKLRAEAYLFYSIVRMIGWYYWPKEGLK